MRRTHIFFSTVFLFVAISLTLTSCAEQANDASSTETTVEPREGTDWCELTRRYEVSGDCERFQQQIDSLDAGVDAFKPKQVMPVDTPTTVRYAIKRLPKSIQGEDGEIAEAAPEAGEVGTEVTVESAETPTDRSNAPTQAEIDQALAETEKEVSEMVVEDSDSGNVAVEQIKVSTYMYACLEGDATFNIEPKNCQSIDTLERPEAVWNWQVTPSEPGKKFELRLISGHEVRATDGTTRRIGQPGRRAEIDVAVTRYRWWSDLSDTTTKYLGLPLPLLAALSALIAAIGGVYGAYRMARRGNEPSKPE
ncbi:hypothetical protein [Parasphingorhabdus halotolerans]|uniref:Uncharacterized protein n=1 Tax=Parasphingorhabdus halotolerans TaxID=2725558 RepID=A0A6H2DL79_9SPHN|nr:hypothetical protein [Parasphingorhabdus halotolerans]QJB68897.1 hypothetical protein HF685_06085 [Parasphingorhabdus halotolerans]